MATFEWSKRRLKAAQLIACGELSVPEVAAKLKVSRRTVFYWLDEKEFTDRVAENVARIKVSLGHKAISRVERRIDRLNRDWLKLQRVINERAVDPEMAKVPGGTTGTLAHSVKGIGAGDSFRVVDVYEVDTGLLKELRDIEKQAAQELGQWIDKADLTSDGKAVAIQYVNDWRAPRADDSTPLPAPGPDRG